MSSVQDRIRRLQSTDQSPDAPQPATTVAAAQRALQSKQSQPQASVSSLTSLFASPAENAPASSARPVAELATTLEHTALSGSRPRVEQRAAALNESGDKRAPSQTALQARINRLESGVDSEEIASRVRRLESGSDVNKLAARGIAGSAVADTRGAFERSDSKVDAGDQVRKRAGLFELQGSSSEANGSAEENPEADKKPAVMAGASVFEKEQTEDKPPVGVLSRTTAFENDARSDGTNENGEAPRPAIGNAALFEQGSGDKDGSKGSALKRAAIFERDAGGGTENDQKEEKEEATRKAEIPRSHALRMQRQADLDRGHSAEMKEKDWSAAKVGSLLSNRAGMFERPVDSGNKSAALEPSVSRTAEAKESETKSSGKPASEADGEKQSASQSPSGLKSTLEVLQEVKALNQDLVSRLIELTGAFKRLEKSREELQSRITRLEKK